MKLKKNDFSCSTMILVHLLTNWLGYAFWDEKWIGRGGDAVLFTLSHDKIRKHSGNGNLKVDSLLQKVHFVAHYVQGCQNRGKFIGILGQTMIHSKKHPWRVKLPDLVNEKKGVVMHVWILYCIIWALWERFSFPC